MTVMGSAPMLKPALTQKITRLRLWHVPLTSHTAYHMADGKSCDTVETVVIAVDTGAGIVGWGEVCPIPHYLPAYARGVAPALTELAPVLLGADPLGAESVMARADACLPGHVYAKSALDIALWDITARVAGLPLYTLLGGRRQADLPLYHSITCVDPDEMARIAAAAHASGITQFQAKLGASGDWQTDVERLAKVREAVGPGPLVYGDWNCGATSLDAIRVGRAAARFDVMLEQPCATLEDCARVHHATGLPMKLDELAHDTASLLEAHRLGIMDAVALKLSKFGGLSATRRARDLCRHLGARMCIECTWGSDIVTAAALHLGAATEPARLLNVCDLAGYVSPRLAPDAPIRNTGRIAPPEGPGLGITVDTDLLGEPDLTLE
ncbi:mandelate racemase/muconate lactonizing enzyme family protein [Ovoidimarina sediminis]|uniref:mandelate racemase/muconate lactonizing enzyme family protein n=1 Tax=Ovoidimarina sediminis TaxID=3079856 RepID=UPI002912017A|nr:enolase C-terminal domain-like protein [Rhodophyticola sp. MJ-SS7]MDU8945733.1 enolase C-terminal domain-like protein [Rhodophyticola sp. MJ-SS7]